MINFNNFYFFQNKEWYIDNPNFKAEYEGYKNPEPMFLLTDKAPPEAVKSYKKFCELMDSSGREREDGSIIFY